MYSQEIRTQKTYLKLAEYSLLIDKPSGKYYVIALEDINYIEGFASGKYSILFTAFNTQWYIVGDVWSEVIATPKEST